MTTAKPVSRGIRVLGAMLLFGAAYGAAYWFDRVRSATFDEADPFPPAPAAPEARRLRVLDSAGDPLPQIMTGVFDAEFGVTARRRFAAREVDVLGGGAFAPAASEGSETFAPTFGVTDSDGYIVVPWTDRPLTVVARDRTRYAARIVAPGDRGDAELRLMPDRSVVARVVGEAGTEQAGKPVANVVVVFSVRESAAGPVTERVLAVTDEDGRASLSNPFVAPSFLTAGIFPREADAVAVGVDPPVLTVEELPERFLVFVTDSTGKNPAAIRFLDHDLPGAGTSDALAADLVAWLASMEATTLRTPDIAGKAPQAMLRMYDGNPLLPQFLSLERDRMTSVPSSYASFSSEIRPSFRTTEPNSIRWRRRVSRTGAGPGGFVRPASAERYERVESGDNVFDPPFAIPGVAEDLIVEGVGELGRSGDRPGAVVVGSASAPLASASYGSTSVDFSEAWRTNFCVDVVDTAGRAVPGVAVTFEGADPYVLLSADGRFELSNRRKATMRTDASGRIVGYSSRSDAFVSLEYDYRTASGTAMHGGFMQKGIRPVHVKITIP